MEEVAVLIVVAAFAFLAESTTEYCFGLWVPSKYIRYVAMAVGVLLSILYRINVPKDLMHVEAIVPWAGEVLTGLIIGRGSNFVHDFAKTYLGSGSGTTPTPIA